jgi:hypothetical protein
MQNVLLEALIEDQNIERDLKLLKLIDETDVRVSKYAGLHKYPFSIGILDAYKLHAVTAIALEINSKLAFISKIPSKEGLEEIIQ